MIVKSIRSGSRNLVVNIENGSLLNFVLKHEELKALSPSLDEYMHFMSSVDCKLESERSLPMPQMLIERRRMLLLQKNAKRRPHPHRIPCLG
jgi:hypothetical protein